MSKTRETAMQHAQLAVQRALMTLWLGRPHNPNVLGKSTPFPPHTSGFAVRGC